MQATGYYPPEGASKEQAKELLDICFEKAKVFDLVEFNPKKISLNEDKLIFDLFNNYFNIYLSIYRSMY